MNELSAAINANKQIGHQLIIRDDGAHLKIGWVYATDASLNRLLLRAVNSGKIVSIDTDAVIGPKVLHFLTRLSVSVPAGKKIKISGRINPNMITSKKLGQQLAYPPPQEKFLRWSSSESKQFDAAFELLKIKEGCLKVWKTEYVSQCGWMSFSFDVHNPENIVWEPWVQH